MKTYKLRQGKLFHLQAIEKKDTGSSLPHRTESTLIRSHVIILIKAKGNTKFKAKRSPGSLLFSSFFISVILVLCKYKHMWVWRGSGSQIQQTPLLSDRPGNEAFHLTEYSHHRRLPYQCPEN